MGRLSAARPAAVTRRTYALTGTCAGCGACLRTCPEAAIRPGQDIPLVVLAARCTGCGECAEVCPVDALGEIDADEGIGGSR